MADDFDLAAYNEELRLKAAGMSNDDIAELLTTDVDSCVRAAENEFSIGDDDEHCRRLEGVLLEAARRLRAATREAK